MVVSSCNFCIAVTEIAAKQPQNSGSLAVLPIAEPPAAQDFRGQLDGIR
jgi:hypothetical protein